MCCLESLVIILGAIAVSIVSWVASLVLIPRLVLFAVILILAVRVLARKR
ncbi:MAG: hypothetical protein QUS11_11070 [Candidatus Fermentibacter sp.]|nr:hypothetical protein [Candidatus Fermentibacter sp.]